MVEEATSSKWRAYFTKTKNFFNTKRQMKSLWGRQTIDILMNL